jgi:hypothetical protein
MDDILVSASMDQSSYPLWILFSVERLRLTGKFLESLPVHTDMFSGEQFAPLFTDKDLAQRWLDEHPLHDARELMPIEDLSRLSYVLQCYLKGGVHNVGTDFVSRQFGRSGSFGQLRTIAVFLKEIEDH